LLRAVQRDFRSEKTAAETLCQQAGQVIDLLFLINFVLYLPCKNIELGKVVPQEEESTLIGNFRNHLLNHIQGNKYLYILIVFFFILGVAAGSYMVKMLNPQQVNELISYLDKFLSGVAQWNVEPTVIAQHTVINNLKIILFFWFLGLTVIGVPLILLIVLFRGFVMGFTIGFLYQQKSLYGLIMALLAIVPPSTIYLPATIIGAAAAVTFSYWLIRGRSRGLDGSILQQFIAYNFIMLVISLFAVLAGIIEAYLSPTFIKIFSNLVSL